VPSPPASLPRAGEGVNGGDEHGRTRTSTDGTRTGKDLKDGKDKRAGGRR